MLLSNGSVFSEEARLPPDGARVETDQIGQVRSPHTLEEDGRLGSETSPGGTHRRVSIVAVTMAKIVGNCEPKYSQE